MPNLSLVQSDMHRKPGDPREQDVIDPHPHGNLGEVCIGCGLETRLHQTISGTWIGCKGALTRQTPQKNPERWNDPYPAVTCEVRKALLLECGPAMEIHLSSFTHDEVLSIAHALAKAAIAAYLREIAK